MRTGIEVHDLPGNVPKFYEMDACDEANYRFYHDWQELTVDQKAEAIAKYYLKQIIAGHKEEAATLEMEKRQKKAKGKKGSR